MDSWWAHLDDDVADDANEQNTKLADVGKSCTPFVQPLDTHINKIFRKLYRDALMEFLADKMVEGDLLRS